MSEQARRDRLFAALIAFGLAVEAVELAAFGPGTFVTFAFVGLPAILVGTGYFATHALRLVFRGDAS